MPFDDCWSVTEPVINDENAGYYLREVRLDLEYYRRAHSKAAIRFDVAGVDAEQAAEALAELLLTRDQAGE